ncbi:hypothetical protein [Oceanidesulfovibrio marinus]|uniref:hypothetical protein n=1 Tax=Oceanidesulfovibrio marinus TaxID=370038 RepID=UPI001186EA0A|nr:hypothetical protein [Oceanidesulfovibrio marinus]
MKARIKRYLLGFSIAMSVYLILVLLYIYPHLPKDYTGWIIVCAVGIPLYVLWEVVVGYVISREVGSEIASKSFSIKRIMFAVVALSVVITGLLLMSNMLQPLIGDHFR